MMMRTTSQAGGKPSGTGSAAGAAMAVCAPTRGWPASPLRAGLRRPGGPQASRGVTAALTGVMSRPGFDQSRGYEPSPRGYGESAPRSRDDQRTERIPAARRGGRYQDAPEPATPVGARASRAAAAPRRGAVGTDTGPGNPLYDTGPSAADLTATRISADPDLADSDVFPRVRAEIPETEAKPRPKNQAKGRGRASRGRHDDDDDDWPSTEWDKLSDEQYWAELSADKPLATTARSCPAQRSRPGGHACETTPGHHPASGVRARRIPAPASAGRRAGGPGPPPPGLPTVPGGRAAVRARPGGRMARTPTLGVRGLAERPAAAAATERLPARRRPPPSGPGWPRHRTCPQPPRLPRPGPMTTR